MYQSLLTRRYLLSKVMPLLAALAVALCTAMVLVVWSVMGGFLNTLLAQGRGMIGDVSIAYPVVGIPYYEELIGRLEGDPLVEAATPTIESLGLLGLDNGEQRAIQCIGIEPKRYDEVTGYDDRLWWRPIEKPLPRDSLEADPRLDSDRRRLVKKRLTDLERAVRGREFGDDVRGLVRKALEKYQKILEKEASNADRRAAFASLLLDVTFDVMDRRPSEEVLADAPAKQHAWERLSEPLVDARETGYKLVQDNRIVPRLESDLEAGRELEVCDDDVARPAMVLGVEVTRYNRRRKEGFLDPIAGLYGPSMEYTVGVLPLSRKGVAVQLESRMMRVANEFRSGMYDIDANWVIMPLDMLQRMLKMDEQPGTDPDWYPGMVDEEGNLVMEPEARGTIPGRVTNILIRAAAGVSPHELEPRVEEIYQAFALEKGSDVPLPVTWRKDMVYRWEEKPGLRTFISAVKKETALVLVLFAFISLTAVFLVCAIFWAMVSEKTKDIGTLRALGASRAGIAWLYLRYGLAIGLVGSAVGGVLAFLVVTNINPIHEWLGQELGIYVWDPSVYYFTEIPNKVELSKAAFVLVGGVVFSVVGALLPAIRAAWMDPVKALRFE